MARAWLFNELRGGRARRHARAVDVAAGNVPFRARCLERSLALWRLLRRRRMAAELRIGVRKSERDLEAHAWVELAGRVVNDRADVHRRYAAFDGAYRFQRCEVGLGSHPSGLIPEA